MKKRILSVLLLLMITVVLVACSAAPSAGDSGNQGGSGQILDPQNDPLAFLEAAGEKLKNAESFQMDIWHWALNLNTAEPEAFSLGSTPTQNLYEMQYVSDSDGSPASYLKEFEWGSSSEAPQVEEWHYLGSKTGYGGQGSEQYDDNFKHFSEKGFTEKQRFWILGTAMDIGKDTLFAEFCELKPTVTTAEDGTTSLEAHLTYEQLRSLLNVELPMHTTHDSEITGRTSANIFARAMSPEELSLEFIVNSEGYLCHIIVKKWTCLKDSTDYNWVDIARIISFSRINEKIEIDTSSISQSYLKNPEQHHYLVHHYHDDCQAIYKYDPQRNVFDYDHIQKNMYDHAYIYNKPDSSHPMFVTRAFDVILPPYRLYTEIDGFQVETKYHFSDASFEEQLIVPKGVTFNYGYHSEALGGAFRNLDKVFFEDTAETAKINVRQTTGTNSDDIYLTLSEAEEKWGGIPYYTDNLLEKFYFAGEWEYVDGVPTPIE